MNKNILGQVDSIKDLVVPRSEWAWTYLSLGNVQEACRLGRLENDIIVWAASLALSGDSRQALYIIESYIIATCRTVAELVEDECQKEAGVSVRSNALHKHNSYFTNWLTTRMLGTDTNEAKSTSIVSETPFGSCFAVTFDNDAGFANNYLSKCRTVINTVMQLVSSRELYVWYIIALILLDNVNTKRPYTSPVNEPWFRYFFAFVQDGRNQCDGPYTWFGDTELLGQERTVEILLSHCSEWEALFVSSLTAFYTHHYRTSIECALQFCNFITPDEKTRKGTYRPVVQIPNERFYRVSMLVVRSCALLELGLRTEAAVSITALMRENIQGDATPSEYIFMFGCALGLYGMPLRDVVQPLNNFLEQNGNKAAVAPLPARVHVLSTVYYVHALTLLQLGQMNQVAIITKMALSFNPPRQVREALRNIALRAYVSRDDSASILAMQITEPEQLLYLSLCPTFFGGLSAAGISAKRHTPLFQLLYPKDLPLYPSVRQLLPFYMNRAFFLFHHRCYDEAWENVCCAVELADQIAGSTEFAFTGCFPLHVYHFACKVGFTTLEHFLRKDMEKFLINVDPSANSNPRFITRLMSFPKRNRSRVSSISTDASAGESLASQLEDKIIDQIIDLCRYCVEKIYTYYPYSVLGDVTAAQVAVMSYDPNSVLRAILLSRRYPDIILAQTTWCLALFFDNKVSNAMDALQKIFQDFPHSSEVVATQKWIGLRGIRYIFHYRGLFPVSYGPSSPNRRMTKRFFVSMVLIAMNWIVFIVMFLINRTSYRPFSHFKNFETALTIPATWTFFLAPVFLVYAFVVTFTQQNLVQTLLEELHFCQYSLTRFIFVMRSIVMINTANLIQVIFSKTWNLPNGSLLIALLFTSVIVLTMPFTTRLWFLPSVDEPEADWTFWISLFLIDTVTYPFVVIPHVILVLLEPLMALVFFAVVRSVQLGTDNDAESIRRKLLYHEKSSYTLLQSDRGKGRSFIYIQIIKLLYYQTHADMFSKDLEKSQIESEGYRVFPLIDEVLAVNIPLDHSWLDMDVELSFLENQSDNDSENTSSIGLPSENPLALGRSSLTLLTSPTFTKSSTSPTQHCSRNPPRPFL